MSKKPGKLIKGDEKTVTEKTSSSSDPLVIKSSKGKPIIITRIEDPTDVKRETEAETVNLRAFKDHPIEYLQEASQREYELEGDEEEIELEYDEMTESDVEREVQKIKARTKSTIQRSQRSTYGASEVEGKSTHYVTSDPNLC